VTVMEVDVERKRISLSMKDNPSQPAGTPENKGSAPRNDKVQKTKPARQETVQKRFSNSPFADALKKR
jgi:transcriptional accessory protein Tex/SPT6